MPPAGEQQVTHRAGSRQSPPGVHLRDTRRTHGGRVAASSRSYRRAVQTGSGSWDVEVIADSDSRWKWGAAVVPRLAPGARVHATLLTGRASPNAALVADVGAQPYTIRRASLADTVARLADTEAQVVVLACVGGAVQALLHGLEHAWASRRSRPVIVTGYVGLVYEKVVDGLLLRAGADIVLANCAADHRRFREILLAAGVDPSAVVPTALPFLAERPYDPTAAYRDRPYTVTFVTQPDVPAPRAERRHALQQAVEHAVRHPDRRVLVKLRGRRGERTTHVEPYHYSRLLPARELPGNLEFGYGPMSPVLDVTDLCVTVSSTAAVEAMHRHIPTAILTDFGIREALGNHIFLGSGCYTAWSALHDGAVPELDPAWAQDNGVIDTDAYSAAAARVAELVAGRAELPPLRPWLDARTAEAYVPGMLGRHGLDRDGRAMAAATGATALPLASRAIRGAARKLYGVGTRVLEPRIKRLAEL